MSFGGAALNGIATAAIGAILAQGLALGWVWSFGPHGFTQSRPHCEAEQVCVLVAGLKDDVSLGFGAAGQIVGLDVRDDTAQRLVDDLNVMTADGRRVRVLRYPVEIGLPTAGEGGDETMGRVLARARREGTAAGATLVVVGRVVNDDNVVLAFVDPRSSGTQVSRIQYELGDSASRAALLNLFSASIAAAGHAPLPQTPLDTLPTPTPPQLPPVALAPDKPNEAVFAPPDPTPTPAPANVIVPPRVGQWPTAAEFERAYPDRARERGRTGRAVLRCQVTIEQRATNCVVLNESPQGWGFGEAALRLANQTEVYPQLVDGQPTNDGMLDIPYVFRLREGR